LLGIDQSKVSRITRGQFRGVNEANLLELVTKLGHDVKIVVPAALTREIASGSGERGRQESANSRRSRSPRDLPVGRH
jgi:hypothetical protein